MHACCFSDEMVFSRLSASPQMLQPIRQAHKKSKDLVQEFATSSGHGMKPAWGGIRGLDFVLCGFSEEGPKLRQTNT